MIGDIIDFVQFVLATGIELLLLCLVASILRLVYVIKHCAIEANGDLGEKPQLVLTSKIGPVESTMAVSLRETDE